MRLSQTFIDSKPNNYELSAEYADYLLAKWSRWSYTSRPVSAYPAMFSKQCGETFDEDLMLLVDRSVARLDKQEKREIKDYYWHNDDSFSIKVTLNAFIDSLLFLQRSLDA